MAKLRINMFGRGVDIPGQGVGSAFHEQVALLRTRAAEELDVAVNARRAADVNHFNTVDPGAYLRCVASRVPTVAHVHFLPETLDGSIKLPAIAFGPFRWYVKKFYRAADNLVVVNPIFIAKLGGIGVDPARVTYIPNFVSREDFHPLPDEDVAPLRAEHRLEEGRFTVLGVGQVQTRKGVLDFIEVARQLPEIQFVWCGGFSFGKITDGYAELKEAVADPPPNVRFVGIVPRSEMNQYYNLADCLFLPSFSELFPMSILEACNVRLPVLVRDLDLYEDILMGNYLRADGVEGFVGEIRHLSEDSAYREQWSAAAGKIEEFYSPEHVSQLWIDYYRRVAAQKR